MIYVVFKYCYYFIIFTLLYLTHPYPPLLTNTTTPNILPNSHINHPTQGFPGRTGYEELFLRHSTPSIYTPLP